MWGDEADQTTAMDGSEGFLVLAQPGWQTVGSLAGDDLVMGRLSFARENGVFTPVYRWTQWSDGDDGWAAICGRDQDQASRSIAPGSHDSMKLKFCRRYERALLARSSRLQEQSRRLSRQILTAQEDERKKISRELHQVVGQTLTEINLRLARLKKESARSTKGLERDITRAQRLVDKSVNTVHQFARELRPAVLDDLGLIPALHSFMKGYTARTGVRTRLTAFAGVEQLDTARRTVFFRVAQEALANVARHSQASHAEVSIQQRPEGICMKIKDDGKSFQVERVLHGKGSNRLGLLGMRERLEMVGGHFGVESAPGKGTTVTAEIPRL